MQFMSTLRDTQQGTARKQAQQKKNPHSARQSLNSNRQSLTSNRQSATSKQLSPVCLYHIDSTYQGTINASHYREGFGILQTLSFHTFVGYFKNGRAQGLGLIILNSGARIYGNFTKDELNGIGLVDDGKFIKLGVWSKYELNGIGFEYEYDKYLWRMVKFYKGIVNEVIKEEASDIEGKIPSLVNLQHSLYFLLLHYQEHNYFPENSTVSSASKQRQKEYQKNLSNDILSQQSPANKYMHLQGPRTIYFGLLDASLQSGLGLKYDKSDRSVIEAGFYLNGNLHGYGVKYNNTIRLKQLGMYVEGRKEGVFMHDDGRKISYCLYRDDNFLEALNIDAKQLIKKKQKDFNYKQKSFISQKNTLDLELYEALIAKVCHQKQMYSQQKQVGKFAKSSGEESVGKNYKKQLEQILQKKQKGRKVSPQKGQDIKIGQSQRTSVALLKEKFKYFQIFEQQNSNHEDNKQRVMMGGSSRRQQGQERVKWRDQQVNVQGRRRRDEMSESEQMPIAQEENPFVFGVQENQKPQNRISNHFKVQTHWELG